MVFRKQKMKKEEVEKLEEEIKQKISAQKKELETLKEEDANEKEEDVNEKEEEDVNEKKLSWSVGTITIQTEPVIINAKENKSYTIYEAIAELLNRTEEN